jgi:hypothetical protein
MEITFAALSGVRERFCAGHTTDTTANSSRPTAECRFRTMAVRSLV